MLKIAHRGASGYELENSMSAFRKAIELGCDYIEADVRFSADNYPLILHDRFLDRTTNMTGRVVDFNFQSNAKTCQRINGEPIVQLHELCQLANENNIRLYLDFKASLIEPTTLETILSYLQPNQFIIASFHSGLIKKVKEKYPIVQTGLILEGNPIFLIEEINECNCDMVSLGFETLYKTTVENLKKMGRQVFTWTINQPVEFQLANKLGVDGIVSDYPDLI